MRCPYAPGATSNVCSEQIVYALTEMGYDTGVERHPRPADFDAIRERALAKAAGR